MLSGGFQCFIKILAGVARGAAPCIVMSNPVNSSIAKKRGKPRNRRVEPSEPLKDAKIEARIPADLKRRFKRACAPAKMATVLCLLVEDYTKDREERAAQKARK